ncbi:NUDIX hydrolase [Bacillus horti]|uniref:Aminoglycoside 6'-N-acetyltransferase n=1 Tax=Caldalkalibacillus horti TaxID=77523 RepID=A0ABT9VXP2_9BACI|nr:NUDIX hydrolase [Bacillus horti]MDQ0165756.1 aminoglycoside 6'-N-acetyltransferase [Bacillus horti]
MKKWFGSSGVCLNSNGEVLMVLQGKTDEDKTWSIPSGGKEGNETFEECCIREVHEETGYDIKIIKKLKVKEGISEEHNLSYEVHYFLIQVVGGERNVQDPDGLIHDIQWKSVNEIEDLVLSFPEDRDFLMKMFNRLE